MAERMALAWLWRAAALAFLLGLGSAFKHDEFKTCEQANFCKRNRRIVAAHHDYRIESRDVRVVGDRLEAAVWDQMEPNVTLSIAILAYEGGIVRLQVRETQPRAGLTVGAFWLNGAEMFVDVSSERSGFLTGKHVVSRQSHWIAESGIVDFFFMPGPSPADVAMQYAQLTGTASLPPMFGISYHQCRWNYNDQEDVKLVDASFDEHDIPYDVIWLDIEHTDGKRYLTWDRHKFPEPKKMQQEIASKGRKMVTIVDPHIKRDKNYPSSRKLKSLDIS
eukprot:jgi/Pico_ML_1/54342/g4704.t1